MFGNKVSINDNNKKSEKIIYNFAEHCREDENLCGKDGSLYEGIANTIKIEPRINDTRYKNDENTISMSITNDEIKKLINDYYKFLRNDDDW
jgi:hypothetical protein